MQAVREFFAGFVQALPEFETCFPQGYHKFYADSMWAVCRLEAGQTRQADQARGTAICQSPHARAISVTMLASGKNPHSNRLAATMGS